MRMLMLAGRCTPVVNFAAKLMARASTRRFILGTIDHASSTGRTS